MPPNYDKPIYKEFGINSPPEPGIKNPINYTIKQAMRAKSGGGKKIDWEKSSDGKWKPKEDFGNGVKVSPAKKGWKRDAI
jgi:hypothetical protein